MDMDSICACPPQLNSLKNNGEKVIKDANVIDSKNGFLLKYKYIEKNSIENEIEFIKIA
ncbi:MAG: hypothetical protein ACP5LM_02050 [Thermoplasmata archaeon]